MAALTRAPILLETTESLRLGGITPIHPTAGNWYAIYALPIGPVVPRGSVFDLSYTLHVTNDAFRPNNEPVAWAVQVRLSDTLDHVADGVVAIPEMLPHRIGDDAHHGLIVSRGLYVTQDDLFGDYYFKLLTWFSHSEATGSQMMECPDNGIGIQALWYRP